MSKYQYFTNPGDYAFSHDKEHGQKVYRLFFPSERYVIDFADEFTADGWEQFDTDQDAPYFGVWVNRGRRHILTYAEGDWTLVVCPTTESYNAEIKEACDFYGKGFICKAIDHETGELTTYVQDRSRF